MKVLKYSILAIFSFSSISLNAASCLFEIRGHSIIEDTFKISATEIKRENEMDKKIRKVNLKVCRFGSGSPGGISGAACEFVYDQLVKGRSQQFKLKTPGKKTCASLKNGDWISGVKTLSSDS